jgi:carboxymethylenebutenolidase
MSGIVTLKVENAVDMAAYLSVPEGNGPFPAVIVFQEAFGVNSHIKNVVDRIATMGYIAIAPELFHRTAPVGFDSPYGNFAAIQPHYIALTNPLLEDDIHATFNYLQQMDNVQKNKIASIGFCLGGKVSFIANSILPLSAAISFYGGGTHTIADRAENLSADHLFFWCGKDQHITPEHIQTITSAMDKAGKNYINAIISYAEHGFNCDERAAFHPLASKEAWALVTAFLKNRLD